jgi:glutamyl endopeptidase
VASDGLIYAQSNAASQLRGVSSFPGTGKPSNKLAALSERIESTTELSDLLAPEPAPIDNGRETVIGPDSRARVKGTASFPARATALITFAQRRTSGYMCTGWFISSNTVVTAGHCVHSGGPNGVFSKNVKVFPGRNGSRAPFGSCTARKLFTVAAWTTSSDERYDYGAIKLNCNVGKTTGWYGFFSRSSSLNGHPSTVRGYPGDKPLTQWKSNDQIRVLQQRQLFYRNDTLGGMSGSPVYEKRSAGSAFCVGMCAMAVHAYGLHGSPPHSTYNHGARITRAVFNNLVTWRNAQ